MTKKILLITTLFAYNYNYSMQPQPQTILSHIVQGGEKIYNILWPEDEVFENLTPTELNDKISEIQTKTERAEMLQKDLKNMIGILVLSLFLPIDKIKCLKKVRFLEEGRLVLAACVGLCSMYLDDNQKQMQYQLSTLDYIKRNKNN
ncbi:hypothetical protein M1446_00430 [Candidatus Dependentiae bacterium]|nr:hypothetical protein [Candidatus Dependentiae bacterium]